MRLLYVIASYLLYALAFPLLCLHKKTRGGFFERLGFYRRDLLPSRGGPRIWLHGASAGDLLSLSPMIRLFRERHPDCTVIVSTMTNTGHLMASERLASLIDAVIYAPWDLWGATRRAVRAVKPDLLVLEYTEIWPNLIAAASAAKVRIALTNGRFSPGRLSRYHALFAAIGNPLEQMDLLLMREDDEAERALALGAPRDRVHVTGNTKFDALVPLGGGLAAAEDSEDEALRRALALPATARVLIAGSTHEGEEEKVLAVFKHLLKDHPDLRLVIAPRYIDRAQRVLALASAAGLSAGLRSEQHRAESRVVVLDTIGELARAYRLGTVVFVGGSFTTRGGQNILEPAAQGRPVLFGPHMENFRDSVQVLIGRGGIQVNDADHFYRVTADLLARPETVASLGARALGAVREVAGASQRNVERMEAVLAITPNVKPIRNPSAERTVGIAGPVGQG